MAKIQFDIEYRPQIESGEYKVVTDCGEPVEIVKWDCKGKCPILAVIGYGDTQDSCFYHTDGSSYSGKEHIYILTLTEFEKEIIIAIEDFELNKNDGFTESDSARKHAGRILNEAKRLIQPEIDKAIDQVRKNVADVQYSKGYEDGRQSALNVWKKWDEEYCKAEALKDMPKWKPAPVYKGISGFYTTGVGTPVIVSDEGYVIELEDLKKLPKEE